MFSYHHHIGDFRRDTASLSDTDAMAYLKLLWMYYDTELPLPADAKLLAFKIGSNAESVQLILDAFFTLDEDVYRQKRCDAEIIAYYGRKTVARDKANKRWKNATASIDNATALPQHSDSIAPAIKNNANREPRTESKEYSDDFLKFWKAYPKKTDKAMAWKAFKKLKMNDEFLATLIKAVNQQELHSRDIQFVPHASTWLNKKRWEDEIKSASSSNEWWMNDRRIK
jgi:uncharacterized protein YdaU (DUF1376 family)